MLCGHIHHPYLILPGDGQSLLPHSFPILVCPTSKRTDDGFVLTGAALTLSEGKAHFAFTDEKKGHLREGELSL